MQTASLTKTTATMKRLDSRNQEEERSVTFVLDYDDTGQIYRTLILSFQDWVDMGRPDEITCTITPGPMEQ